MTDIEKALQEERRFNKLESSIDGVKESVDRLVEQVSVANGRTTKNENAIKELLSEIKFRRVFERTDTHEHDIAELKALERDKEVEVRLRAKDMAFLGGAMLFLVGVANAVAQFFIRVL